MDTNKINSKSQVFNIRVRINDPSIDKCSSTDIAKIIVKEYAIKDKLFINGLFRNKDIEEEEFSYSLLSSYIKWKINYYYQKYLSDNIIDDKQLKVNVSDIDYDNGSLIITFNLIITTLLNVYTVYRFVKYVVNMLSDDDALNCNGRFITSITACPAVAPIQRNSSSYNKKLFTILISIASALSLIACVLAIIGYFNQYNENDLKAIVKEQTEQVVSKEVPKEVRDAINNEKINYLFNQATLQTQTSPSTGSPKTKENNSLSK